MSTLQICRNGKTRTEMDSTMIKSFLVEGCKEVSIALGGRGINCGKEKTKEKVRCCKVSDPRL